MTYKQTVSRLGVCFLFLMLVTGILQTVASVAVSMLVPGLYETDWFIWVLSYVPLYCIAVPLFLLVGRALLPGRKKTRVRILHSTATAANRMIQYFVFIV